MVPAKKVFNETAQIDARFLQTEPGNGMAVVSGNAFKIGCCPFFMVRSPVRKSSGFPDDRVRNISTMKGRLLLLFRPCFFKSHKEAKRLANRYGEA